MCEVYVYQERGYSSFLVRDEYMEESFGCLEGLRASLWDRTAVALTDEKARALYKISYGVRGLTSEEKKQLGLAE